MTELYNPLTTPYLILTFPAVQPRKGCFEVRGPGGKVFVSLLVGPLSYHRQQPEKAMLCRRQQPQRLRQRARGCIAFLSASPLCFTTKPRAACTIMRWLPALGVPPRTHQLVTGLA